MKLFVRTIIVFIVILLSLSIGITAQDSSTCSATMQQVLNTVGDVCAGLGRNQACYGNVSMETIAREGTNLQFKQVGDIVDAADIQKIKLSPMSANGASWGVAVMSLQASIPDSLPGQNIKFVLFGDVELSSAVSGDNARPMQAFYLKTGIGQAECAEAPENGMLVQTPQGIGEVQFAVNGVNMSLGSTAFLTLRGDNERLSISTLEGNVVVATNGKSTPVVAGSEALYNMDDDLEPLDDLVTIESLDAEEADDLPFYLIDEDREYADPLTDDELDALIEFVENSDDLCGEAPLPSCEDYPWLEDWEAPELEWGDEGFGDEDYDDLFDDEWLDEDCEGDDCGFLDDEWLDEDCEGDDCGFLDDEWLGDDCEGDDCEFFDGTDEFNDTGEGQ